MTNIGAFTRFTAASLVAALCFVTTAIAEHAGPKARRPPKNLAGEEARTVELYREVLPSVVTVTAAKRVVAHGTQEVQHILGSGVLISPDCHVLTAAHVVDGADKILVKTHDGAEHAAELLFSEPSADVALLRLVPPEPDLKHAVLGDSDRVAVGQRAYVVGNPYGLENSFSVGYISGFRQGDLLYDGTIPTEFIQTDAAINSGNSGGPVFNSSGEVIGIASRIVSVTGGSQGLNFMVAINTAKALLALEDRLWVGIEAIFLNRRDLARTMNLDLGGGMLIQRVASGSPAEKAGLKGGTIPARINKQDVLLGGDLIVEFGVQEACHSECLREAREKIGAMRKIPVRFLREGKEMTTVIDAENSHRDFLNPGK